MRVDENNPRRPHTSIGTLQKDDHIKRIHELVVHLTVFANVVMFDDAAEEDRTLGTLSTTSNYSNSPYPPSKASAST